MATNFSQNFTLTDIFNNKRLSGKLPLVNYKESEQDGKVSARTNMKTINRLVYDMAKSSARPYYKPLIATQSGNTLNLGGTLVGDHNQAVDAVFNSLKAQRGLMSFTANDMVIIRSALKEAEKNKRKYGLSSKLYLRANSMVEIEGMTKKQLEALMKDIMDNIIYGDDYPETQKKFNLEQRPSKKPYTYDQMQLSWKIRVGDR